MIDWNGNGSRDNFDRYMDYHIVNESTQGRGKSSNSDSIFRGTGLIYWLICAFAIETLLMNLILDIEDGGIVSLLLAIPVSKFAISLDRKLGKWDEPSESVSPEDMKPWQCCSASTSVVTSTMPKSSDCNAKDTDLRGERLVELSGCIEQFAINQDIQATDYGKVIRMGQDAFIFRAIPRYGNKHVNQQCAERNVLIYWVKGQRTVIGLDELAACELFINGERAAYCIAKSVQSMEDLVGNRYIPRPYNGFTMFTTDGNSRAITIYAPQEILKDIYNTVDYAITASFRQSPFGVIITHDR